VKPRANISDSRRLLLRRKSAVAAILAAVFIYLLSMNLGSFFFFKRTGNSLERSLDSRLLMAATLTAEILQRDFDNFRDSSQRALIRLTLAQIRNRNDFEAAYLLDPRLTVLVDSQPDLSPSRGYLSEDSTELQTALKQGSATSLLHTVAGNHFKNVYSAMTDLYGNEVILVLEANAEFLDVLAFFRKGLLLSAIASVLLFALFTFFLIRATMMLLRTEEQLFRSQRLAVMGQMAATVAHEIRNPLGIIKSTADVLQDKMRPSGDTGDLFHYINSEVSRMNRLVNDFLSLSRDQELKLSEVDLIQLIQQTILSFQTGTTSSSAVVFKSALSACPLRCDQDRIRQAILNLLLNAHQAMEGRTGQILVELFQTAEKRTKFTHVRVTDDGTGIQGDAEEIFNPFHTTKVHGTGLGLTVCRQIVESHGGSIQARKRAEGGTILEFQLPG